MFYRTIENRRTSLLDRVLSEVQQAVSVLSGTVTAERKSPGAVWQQQQVQDNPAVPELSAAEAQHSAGLMRINHVGEVCAQALYRGQAVFCRQESVRTALLQAAQEEVDHLVWCADRVQELKSHTSYLNPLWYLGAYSMGVFAGAIGDKVSLGFMAETERQVEAHLEGHLNSLPVNDMLSRKIVDQMRLDEIEHRTTAQAMGGITLPGPIRLAMQGCAKVMTMLAYRW